MIPIDEGLCLQRNPVGLCINKTLVNSDGELTNRTNSLSFTEMEILFAMADRKNSSKQAVHVNWSLQNNLDRDLSQVVLICMTLNEANHPLDVVTHKIQAPLKAGETYVGELVLPTTIELRSARCTVEEYH